MKIPERLQPLVDEGIVEEVVRPLMSGKEASLFIVIVEGMPCVAKVYKDAEHRSFRHRAGYTEGRRVRNSRQRRAMEKGTKFGKESMEDAWQNAEVEALYRLSDAGLRVPRPHLFSEGVLLMDLIVDAEGEAAPRLFDVEFTEEEAIAVHLVLIREVVYMLCAGMVHGDLSEYNVLIAWDGPIIIDLPQATDAANNPNSRALFVRDVENLTNFLARFAPALAETRYGQEIWDLFERAALFPDTALTGRWKGSDRKADTRSVLREIETAARDAMAKREFEGVDRPRRGKSGPADAARLAAAGDAPAPKGGSTDRNAPRRREVTEHRPAPAAKRGPDPRSAAPQKGPSQKAPPRPSPPVDALDDIDALLFVEPEEPVPRRRR